MAFASRRWPRVRRLWTLPTSRCLRARGARVSTPTTGKSSSDELFPVVGVETLAPRARRHLDVGRVHNLLTRGHLLEANAVVPLHHGPLGAPDQRRALLQVGAEH